MSTKQFFLASLVLFGTFVSTGCASVQMGGTRMYLFDILEYVQVTNNSQAEGDLEVNSEYYGRIAVGQTFKVPFHSLTNMILEFKAVIHDPKLGSNNYLGLAQQTFQPRGRMGETQSWVINYIQMPTRVH